METPLATLITYAFGLDEWLLYCAAMSKCISILVLEQSIAIMVAICLL